MRCERCSEPTNLLGPSYYCRERVLVYECTVCRHTTLKSSFKQIISDFWDMMRGKSLRQDYFSKCKRIRKDGPTPCWCCIGECWGDKLDKEKE